MTPSHDHRHRHAHLAAEQAAADLHHAVLRQSGGAQAAERRRLEAVEVVRRAVLENEIGDETVADIAASPADERCRARSIGSPERNPAVDLLIVLGRRGLARVRPRNTKSASQAGCSIKALLRRLKRCLGASGAGSPASGRKLALATRTGLRIDLPRV